jgi:transcriptional regulator with XRE-family HTH domain
MPGKDTSSNALFTQVKGVIRSLGLDQMLLAEKLGVNQTNISKALNGGNEKTFQRILNLLETEYEVTSLNQHLESAVGNDISEIKAELQAIKSTLEELKTMIGKLEK